jgi:hypothetical protein
MPNNYIGNTASRDREIDQLWKESRLRSGLPQKLSDEEQSYFVPVVVSVLRARSRASSGPRRATASRTA